ncbi:MAG TPA: hypothetical protein VH352_27900, partial [Pseudonocardiaceae bacterium]|nr:hypothetical protein [Pseudonocardiaceae bacterium]
VFNLLTRSGRIGHAELAVRDPVFTDRVDGLLGGRQVAPPPAFAPCRLGELVLTNRIARTGPANGAGLVYSEFVAVRADGRVSPDTPVLDGDRDGWAARVASAHAEGAKFALCLGHAGARGSSRPTVDGIDLPLPDGWPVLAASAVRYGPGQAVPRPMNGVDLAEVLAAFTSGAELAADAGVDLLELDLAHGYLLAGFLSPLTNRRTDEYGGDPVARLRYPLAVVDAIRSVWRRPLSVCLTVDDWHRKGLGLDDGVRIAGCLAEHGVGLIRVSAGQTVAECQPEYRRRFLTGAADRVRSETGVPTVVGGYLTTVDEANTIIGAGRADVCLLVAP